MSREEAYLIVNFGGPRNLEEIPEFLTALLTDRDVIRTSLPSFFQTILFRRIAQKRAKKIVHDYQSIGGNSPIFQATESIAKTVGQILGKEILTFHRYLPETHPTFIEKIQALPQKKIIVFPMFPQFTYATTGSIARWFQDHLSSNTVLKLRWVKSYPAEDRFITCQEQAIKNFLQNRDLKPENTFLFFSAHGLPRRFVCTGDIYEEECERSFLAVMARFPEYKGLLAYQSKFGRGEWLQPYTDEMCKKAPLWNEGKQHIVFIPISFTSDHIETLFEVEQLYLPMIRAHGLMAHRCPALGFAEDWMRAIAGIMQSADLVSNDMLIRHEQRKVCRPCQASYCSC